MIMNDEPQCVENEPRFKLNQKVFYFEEAENSIKKAVIKGVFYNSSYVSYDIYWKNKQNWETFRCMECLLFPDFNSCKVAAHATYLQKIKELLEQKDD